MSDKEDENFEFTRQEQLLMGLFMKHAVTVEAGLVKVEARSRALEQILFQTLSSPGSPPPTAETLADSLLRYSRLHANAILAEKADLAPAIASEVERLLSASRFGPILPPEE